MDHDGNTPPASSAMKQRLLSADEAYVYKIPPLKSSGGHRAEDWNLAKPLRVCRLVVERRGDILVMDLVHEKKLFAQSKVDYLESLRRGENRTMEHFVQAVTDSSRYFVVKIQQGGGDRQKEAYIGFGFRDRDKATDLRECLQHYERSIRREYETAGGGGGGDGGMGGSAVSIPQMAEGETIHVDTSGGKSTIKKKEAGGGGGGGGGVPLLSKKPPPPAGPEGAAAAGAAATTNAKTMQKMAISMGDIDLDADHRRAGGEGGGGEGDASEGSEGAVFTGDAQQWATEFDMPK